MAGEKLLLVEDEDIIRAAMARWLVAAGYCADEASTGEEGLEKLGQGGYDLLLVDLGMPGIDGFEFLRRAREIDSRAGVLLITGYGSTETAMHAIDVGVQGFLMKPFPPEELTIAVSRTLARQSQARESQRLNALGPLVEVTRRIVEGPDLQCIAEECLSQVLECTGSLNGAVYLLEERSLVPLSLRGSVPELPAPSSGLVKRIQEGLGSAGSLEGGKYQVLSWPGLRPVLDGTANAVCLPLCTMGRCNGIVVIGRQPGAEALSAGDCELLWVCCTLLSGAIGSARGVSRLELAS